ncbi:GH23900 [Drosophila grimshawi]|uniref:GH23900 n=1 Tax=Drosophila grimshawi TaxID=7222 RepID=B4K236_DROGR|nr:GH23900 [Drosophila grimshawi]
MPRLRWSGYLRHIITVYIRRDHHAVFVELTVFIEVSGMSDEKIFYRIGPSLLP